MTIQHNAKFNELIYASTSEIARVSDMTAPFVNPYVDSTAEPIPFTREEDNDIYNLGVLDGAVGLLDDLHKAGYQIIDPTGVKMEPSEGSNFSTDYYSRKYWEVVSN